MFIVYAYVCSTQEVYWRIPEYLSHEKLYEAVSLLAIPENVVANSNQDEVLTTDQVEHKTTSTEDRTGVDGTEERTGVDGTEESAEVDGMKDGTVINDTEDSIMVDGVEENTVVDGAEDSTVVCGMEDDSLSQCTKQDGALHDGDDDHLCEARIQPVTNNGEGYAICV